MGDGGSLAGPTCATTFSDGRPELAPIAECDLLAFILTCRPETQFDHSCLFPFCLSTLARQHRYTHVRKRYGAFDRITRKIVLINRFIELCCEPSCNVSPTWGGLLLRKSGGALLRFHQPERAAHTSELRE